MRSAFACFLLLLVTSLTMGLVATKSCTPPVGSQRMAQAIALQDVTGVEAFDGVDLAEVVDVVDVVEELWDDIASAPLCSPMIDAAFSLDDHGETLPSVSALALAPLPRPTRPILPASGALPERHERLLRPPTRA